MKTIAQQLNIKKFPFDIKDEKGNLIYRENSNRFWYKQEFNSERKEIYYEDSDGYWYKLEYDSRGNQIYYENSKGYWEKLKYDSQGKEIYYENSKGIIINKRPKPTVELTLEDIAKLAGVSVEQIKIKK